MRLLTRIAVFFSIGVLSVSAQSIPTLVLPGGVSDYGETPSTANLTYGAEKTLEMWVYPTQWRPYGGREEYGLVMFHKGQLGTHADYSFKLHANGLVAWGTTRNGAWLYRPAVPLNQWTHMACSFNQAARRMTLYINGVRVTDFNTSGISQYVEPSGYPLYIGGFWQRGWGFNNNNFIGRIAEARIWNVERSEQEIRDNMNRQMRGNEAGLVGLWNFETVNVNGGVRTVPDLSGKGHTLTLSGNVSVQPGNPPISGMGSINVAITAPTNNALFRAPTSIVVAATASATSGGVSRVDFFRNNAFFESDSGSPYQATLNITSGGVYSVFARATNDIGLSGNSAAITLKVAGPFKGTPQALPGTLECEDFDHGGAGVAYSDTTTPNEGNKYRLQEQVDIANDGGASNGHVVGWTKAGEWMDYAVSLSTDTNFTLSVRLAGVGTGGTFQVELDGANVTGPLAVPNTGSWSAYQWVRKVVSLPAGPHTLRLRMLANGSSGYVGAFDVMTVVTGETSGALSQSAYPSGTPHPIPGVIEAENYDNGGTAAYSDTTAANEGNQYRTTEAVDIARDTGAGNQHTVGWTKAGEWLEYTIQCAQGGEFTLDARMAAIGTGGLFRIEVNGVDETGNLPVPNTGAWSSYQSVRKSGVSIPTGTHTVRVAMVANGVSGYVMSFDRFSMVPDGQAAYPGGSPWPVPGVIEFENFDLGGSDVAYQDDTAANLGNQYRTTEGVDIAQDTAASNRHVVGWTKAGEWLEYTLNVGPVSGFGHWVQIRVAGAGTGGVFQLRVNDIDAGGPLAVPNTGAWNVYSTVNVQLSDGVLPTGVCTLKVHMVQNGTSGFVGAFDQMRIQNVTPPPAFAKVSGGSGAVEPAIIEVRTSDEASYPGAGWAAVDGNPETVWRGEAAAGGWWMVLVSEPERLVGAVEIDWSKGSPTNVEALYSSDAKSWTSLPLPIEGAPVRLSYLWLIFPASEKGAAPSIREVRLR